MRIPGELCGESHSARRGHFGSGGKSFLCLAGARRTGRADERRFRSASTRRPSSPTRSSSWGPIYTRTHDGMLAWQAGVFASFFSGVVQTALAFGSDRFRRNTPLAALLSPMAGLALAFLCLGFVFGVFQQAAIALLPMIVLFALYASHLRLPFRLPPGLVAVGVRVRCWWPFCAGCRGRRFPCLRFRVRESIYSYPRGQCRRDTQSALMVAISLRHSSPCGAGHPWVTVDSGEASRSPGTTTPPCRLSLTNGLCPRAVVRLAG